MNKESRSCRNRGEERLLDVLIDSKEQHLSLFGRARRSKRPTKVPLKKVVKEIVIPLKRRRKIPVAKLIDKL